MRTPRLLTAGDLADFAGLTAKRFRARLRAASFDWHHLGDSWTVEEGSDRHRQILAAIDAGRLLNSASTPKVFVANFGRQQWMWPECLDTGTIALLDDIDLAPFYAAGDRSGYIDEARRTRIGSDGEPVTRSVASRWYGLKDAFRSSSGDLWLHRSGNSLWWTVSGDGEAVTDVIREPVPQSGEAKLFNRHRKRCSGWSDRDRKGRTIDWNVLPREVRAFLSVRSTFASLSAHNAWFARALVDDSERAEWPGPPPWSERFLEIAGRNIEADRTEGTVRRIVDTVLKTVAASGSVSLGVAKEKMFGFDTPEALGAFLRERMTRQGMKCALTGLVMLMDGGIDEARYVSLDRIDSDGHYSPDNLQLVCRFANRWKGTLNDGEFRRLVEMIRGIPGEPGGSSV